MSRGQLHALSSFPRMTSGSPSIGPHACLSDCPADPSSSLALSPSLFNISPYFSQTRQLRFKCEFTTGKLLIYSIFKIFTEEAY